MKHDQLEYKSPIKFSLKQRVTLSVAANAFSLLHRILCSTCSVEVREESRLREVEKEHGRAIIGFWHEVLPLAIWTHRGTGYHTLTSYSYDGELAARAIDPFGIHAVRGSSSRGGREALVQLETALNIGVSIGITLDGPRGPRRVSKPGAAVLSGKTNTPIIPLVLGAPRVWRMRSWDRMVLPKPFTRMVCLYGKPIPPARDTSPEEVERVRALVERDLNRLQVELEDELGIKSFWNPSAESSEKS